MNSVTSLSWSYAALSKKIKNRYNSSCSSFKNTIVFPTSFNKYMIQNVLKSLFQYQSKKSFNWYSYFFCFPSENWLQALIDSMGQICSCLITRAQQNYTREGFGPSISVGNTPARRHPNTIKFSPYFTLQLKYQKSFYATSLTLNVHKTNNYEKGVTFHLQTIFDTTRVHGIEERVPITHPG